MNKPIVYLAGPIAGLTYAGSNSWREGVALALGSDVKVLSPMRNKEALKDVGVLTGTVEYGHLDVMSTSVPVFARDQFDVARADVLFVNLLWAEKVSIGTVFEIGAAVTLGKIVVLVMEDEGNVHEHLFVTTGASIRVNNLGDGVYATRSFIG